MSLALNNGTATATFAPGGGETHTATYATGFGFRRTSTTTLEIRVDGTSTPATIVNTLDLSDGNIFQIGRASGLLLAASVAETIVVRAPSDADTTGIESYLKSKYGL